MMAVPEHVSLDPRFTGELTYFDNTTVITDGHPDPLREWTDHGDTTPEGWFAVNAHDHSRLMLYLVREIHGDVHSLTMTDPRSGLRYTVDPRTRGLDHLTLGRTVWWTPSEELACDVARQLRDGERQTLQPDPNHATRIVYGTRASSSFGNPSFRTIRAWKATVHQRIPDGVARLVRTYERTAPHQDARPWEYGYRPTMKTWGSREQDVDYQVYNAMGRRMR